MLDTKHSNAGVIEIVRIVIFSAITPLALLVAPVLTGQLMAQFALSPDQVGTYFLFELGGLSLATIPALWWTRRWEPKQIAMVAALIFICGNVASVFADHLHLLYMVRLITAMAGGALMILCLNAAAASPNSDRMFGFWVTGQLVLGAMGLALLPRLFQIFGLDAFFVLTALLMALAFPLVFGFAPRRQPDDSRPSPAVFNPVPIIIAMVILTLYYLAVSGSWSFMTLVAQRASIAELQASDQVATASLFGIAGAVAAALLGGRVPRTLVLFAGFVVLISSMLLLSWKAATCFFVAVCLFKFAWTFALPAILAVIGDHNADASAMSWSNLVIGSSSAVAPAIAGALIAWRGSSAMLLVEALVAGASFLLVMALHRRARPGSD